jgi:hypothetical protein
VSAPVTERARTATRSRTDTIPTQRGTPREVPPGRAGRPVEQAGRGSAQQKAYARRDDRLRRIVGGRPVRTAAATGRPQFVLLIMVLLVVGLVATLWLSTAAAADSYRLKDATAEARALSEQAERLHREVAVLASAPELARRAAELGMTPVQDPARLVVATDGEVEVVGEPRAAVAPPPPVPPAPAGEPQPGAPTEGTAPDGTAPDGTAPDGTAPDGTAPDGTAPDGTAPDGTPADDTGTSTLAAPAAGEEQATAGTGQDGDEALAAGPGAGAEARTDTAEPGDDDDGSGGGGDAGDTADADGAAGGGTGTG